MKTLNPITLIAWLTAALVFGITVAAISISFGNLFELAYANHFSVNAANLWAGVVDGLILVTTLEVLHAKLQQEDARYAWFLVGFATVVSVIFNVWHAVGVFDGLMQALPPVVFATFELLMRQVQAAVNRRTRMLSLAELDGQIAAKQTQLQDIIQQIADKETEAEFKAQTRHAKLADVEDELKDRRAELRDTKRQLEDTKAQLKDIEAEIQFAQAERPDRITERRDIARLLADKGVPTGDIAAYFQVSPKTIERDLQLPASNGVH